MSLSEGVRSYIYTLGATASSATQPTTPSASQPRSQNIAQRMAGLPGDMQKILTIYAGNTEESRLLVLMRLEEDFRNHPGGDLIRVTRKEGTNGRQGGIETATCRDCSFPGTFQKVAEHITSQHWELGLWSCGATACDLKYRRKQDLTRHHSEAHQILGPRRTKKLALQGSQAGGHTTSQSTPAYAPPPIQNQHGQQSSHMFMSPTGCRSEPRRHGEGPYSSSTLPAPSGSTLGLNSQSYQYQGDPAQQPQSRFTSSSIASHAIPSQQQQGRYIHATNMRHDQPGIGFQPLRYAEGGIHAHYQYTQTVPPHPRHLNNQAISSMHDNNDRLFSQETGHASFEGSSNDDIRYLNEGKDDSAEHWHAIRTILHNRHGLITDRNHGMVTSYVKQ